MLFFRSKTLKLVAMGALVCLVQSSVASTTTMTTKADSDEATTTTTTTNNVLSGYHDESPRLGRVLGMKSMGMKKKSMGMKKSSKEFSSKEDMKKKPVVMKKKKKVKVMKKKKVKVMKKKAKGTKKPPTTQTRPTTQTPPTTTVSPPETSSLYEAKLFDPLDASNIVWYDVADANPRFTDEEVTLGVIDEVYDGMVTRESLIFYRISLLCNPTEEEVAGANVFAEMIMNAFPDGFDSFDQMLDELAESQESVSLGGGRNLQDLVLPPTDIQIDLGDLMGIPTCGGTADGLFCIIDKECQSGVCTNNKCGPAPAPLPSCTRGKLGATCAANSDCCSNFCESKQCVSEQVSKYFNYLGDTVNATEMIDSTFNFTCFTVMQVTNTENYPAPFVKKFKNAYCEELRKGVADLYDSKAVIANRTIWLVPKVLKDKPPFDISLVGTSQGQTALVDPIQQSNAELLADVSKLRLKCIVWDDHECDAPDSILNDYRFQPLEVTYADAKSNLKKLEEYVRRKEAIKNN